MSFVTRRSIVRAGVGLIAFTASIGAQTTVTVDGVAASAFVWRGVHFTNRPVVQADAFVTVPVSKSSWVVGVWANAEPMDYDTPSSMRMIAAGQHGPAVTAIAPWIESTVAVKKIALTGGATTYLYPALTGLASAFNTSEVYVKVASTMPLSPKVGIWYDVTKLKGAYVEASVLQTAHIGRDVAFGATTGFSAGQEIHNTETAFFDRAGFAFLDVSAATTVTSGAVSLVPTAHVEYAHDALTRVVGPGDSRRVKYWLGVTVTWAKPITKAAH